MSASIIDGKAIALATRKALRSRVEALKERGVTPCLMVILVGEDPASAIYVRNKEKASEKLGFAGGVTRLPESTTQEELILSLIHI